MPYSEFLAQKKLDSRAMRTAEWDLVSAQLRERAFFMAGVDHARTLQEFRKAAALVAQGRLSPQEARRALREYLRQSGYKAPDGKEGSIRDLSSRRRMDVVIDTNARMAAGWANRKQLLGDPAFPGQQLVRIRKARQPRNWQQRWQEAARSVNYDGVARGGKMVARLDSPIWCKLSRFGLPYPPFDFGSGMGVLPVSARECERLGLTETESPQREPGLNENISAEMGDAETARLAQEACQGTAYAQGSQVVMADLNGSTPATAGFLGTLWDMQKELPFRNWQKESLSKWVDDNRYFNQDEKHTTPEQQAHSQALKDLINRLPETNGAPNDENMVYRALHFKSEGQLMKAVNSWLAAGKYLPLETHIADSFSSSRRNTEEFANRQKFQVVIEYENPRQAKDIRKLYPHLDSAPQKQGKPTMLEAEFLLATENANLPISFMPYRTPLPHGGCRITIRVTDKPVSGFEPSTLPVSARDVPPRRDG